MFAKYKIDAKGKKTLIRHRVVCDCSGDKPLTEQSHKDEVNINNIVRKHGIDMIQKTAMLRTPEMQWDDVTGNDFQEAMLKVTKAQQTFEQLPSKIRKEFDNNPAQFMDFVQNPENLPRMVELGLANAKVETPPMKVEVMNRPPLKANQPVVEKPEEKI